MTIGKARALTLLSICQVARAFEQFKPDLVVSVHPLMQIIPQRVNAALAR